MWQSGDALWTGWLTNGESFTPHSPKPLRVCNRKPSDAAVLGSRPQNAILCGERGRPMPRLSGRHAMLEQLLAEGTKYVFGNPGTTEQAFIDALQDYPQIEYILALQEAVATGIADRYARASGRAAFLQLHIMP